MEPEFKEEPNDIKIYRENSPDSLISVESQLNLFKYETLEESTTWNMHKYIIDHRDKIFGTYLWMIHEFIVSSGYSIDFVGFDQDGAIYVIEVKRKEDQRNRQEVISQILKYGRASSDIKPILDDFKKKIENSECYNKKLEDEEIERLKEKIKTNINENCINAFIVTEDANDDLLDTTFYVSFGPEFRKISVIEIKRMTIDEQLFCFKRIFNKHEIYKASGRKDPADLNQKIARIKITKIREFLEKWKRDWRVDPVSVSSPELLTLKDPNRAIANYYIDKKKNVSYSRAFEANSIVFWEDKRESSIFPDKFKDRVKSFSHAFYEVVVENGKYYCIDLSKIDDIKIDEVFSMLEQIASQKKR